MPLFTIFLKYYKNLVLFFGLLFFKIKNSTFFCFSVDIIKKTAFFLKVDDKKINFLSIGFFLNYSINICRLFVIKNGSVFCIFTVPTPFTRFIETFAVPFLLTFVVLLYLRLKKKEFLEKIIIKWSFYPKIFTILINIEYFICKNPLFSLFSLELLFYSLYKFDTGFYSNYIDFIIVLRSITVIPYFIFRNFFDLCELKKRNNLYRKFLKYSVIYKKMQKREIKVSRIFLFFQLAIFYKKME